MLTYLLLILSSILYSAFSNVRVFGWYDGHPEIQKFPWDRYTHVRYGSPIVGEDGSTECNTTQMQTIVSLAHSKDTQIFWAPGDIRVLNTSQQYWDTIGSAVRKCGVDGISVDYEGGPNKLGIVTPSKAAAYTKWLAKLRVAASVPVAADISIWGIAPGNYLLGAFPWIDVGMLNAGAFDFVNTMSYHWNAEGDIWAWEKDVWFLTNFWGIDPHRVNLGIGYFSKVYNNHKLISEPSWNGLSQSCPNIPYDQNKCNGVVFVGKKMNYDIGRLIATSGLGGAFPWELSYDSYEHNNTLVDFLIRGMDFNV